VLTVLTLTDKSFLFLLMFSFSCYISGQLFQSNFIRVLSTVLRTEEMAEKKILSILSHFNLPNCVYGIFKAKCKHCHKTISGSTRLSTWLDSLHNFNDYIKHFIVLHLYLKRLLYWSSYILALVFKHFQVLEESKCFKHF